MPIGNRSIRRSMLRLVLFAPLIISVGAGAVAAAEAVEDPEAFRPQWQVGQQWVVETIGRQTAVRRDSTRQAAGPPIRWKFHVAAVEPLEQQDCYRVEVTCVLPGDQPSLVMWVDRRTMTLRRIDAQLPVGGQFRTVTESYRSDSGQPFPVIAPLTVPPLELPLFLAGTKGVENFSYEAADGAGGEKAVGEIGFSVAVQQRVQRPDEDKIKGLLPDDFTKGVEKKPVAEVHLQGARWNVRQVWQAGQPWPVFSSNPVAESRLVQVDRGERGSTQVD